MHSAIWIEISEMVASEKLPVWPSMGQGAYKSFRWRLDTLLEKKLAKIWLEGSNRWNWDRAVVEDEEESWLFSKVDVDKLSELEADCSMRLELIEMHSSLCRVALMWRITEVIDGLDWAWKWFWWQVEYVYLIYRMKNVEKRGEQVRKSRKWLDIAGYCEHKWKQGDKWSCCGG